MDLDQLIIYEKTLPAKRAIYTPYPANLHPELKDYLHAQGIEQIYCHQAEMFEKARNGENVVITTSTASGKTLSFLLPVIQEILENPLTRAIFVYPTKALAADQYRALLPYVSHFGEHRISAGVYDGDTPPQERSRIRKNANIILTNPEMLNGAFLPNHSKYGFDFIFSNLKYVVIDELHTYRGAFGSHLANVFRRFERICRYYKVSPQFLCSSATIANPVELAANICGTEFSCVSKDGSPSSEKRYLFMQPPKIMSEDQKYLGQERATTVAAELLPELLENKESFIAFTKSRRGVEVVLKETKDHIDGASFLGHTNSNLISGYRGGYTPLERKKIESQMVKGELLGLISTNALELGIDIGQVSNTVLIGYPGTRASFWQQTGRAGRRGDHCTNYLILEQNPFDQYIAIEPGYLFDQSSENAVVDPNNLFIELAHIRAAAAEIPLTLDDISLFPDLGETIPVLLNMDEVRNQNGRFAWNGGEFPAGDFSMRNIDQNRYKLIHADTGKEITEMDESQAFREIHSGAVYMHDGISYQVTKLDLDTKTAYATDFKGNFYTVSCGETNVKIIHELKQDTCYLLQTHFGDVNVDDYVYMYQKLQFHNHQNLGFEKFLTPLNKDYDTESCWISVPSHIVQVYRKLLMPDQYGNLNRNNHFDGLCFVLKNAALMVTMAEKDDIGVITSLNALELSESSMSDVSIYFHDCYVGGLGYSEKIYDLLPDVLDKAKHILTGCKCEDGCAACVGDYHLNKRMILWGIENMTEQSEPPADVKIAPYAPAVFQKKEFRWQDLEYQWSNFCKKAIANGAEFAQFLNTVKIVSIQDRTITLFVAHAFYMDWANTGENRKSLSNIIRYYVDTPADIQVNIQLLDESKIDKEKQDKMYRRYNTLTEKDQKKDGFSESE